MRLKILGLQGSDNVKLITSATKKMRLESVKAALSVSELSEEEIAEILISHGVAEAEARQAAATLATSEANITATGTTGAFTAATKGLGVVLKGVWATLKANPFIAVVGALAVAAVAIEYFSTSFEESLEKIDEAENQLSETNSELESAENQLKEVSNRISEIQSKGNISITDKADLATLKAEQSELRAKIKLLEKQKAIQEATLQKEKNESWKKANNINPFEGGAYYSTGEKMSFLEYAVVSRNSPHMVYNAVDAANSAMEKRAEALKEISQLESLINSGRATEAQEERYQVLSSLVLEYENNLSNLADNFSQCGSEGEAMAYMISASLMTPAETLSELKTLLNDTFDGKEYTASDISALYGKEGHEVLTGYIDALVTAGVLTDTTDFSPLVNQLDKVENAAQKAGNAIENKFITSLTKVDKMASGLDKLDAIYADIVDGADFDYSSILNNSDFAETFDQLDSYESFIQTIANYPDDISACQSAFDKLTAEYIENSGALDDVTEETKQATIALLKQKGVANAEAVVNSYLKRSITVTKDEYKKLCDVLGETPKYTQAAANSLVIEQNALAEVGISAEDARMVVAASQAGMTIDTIENVKKRIEAMKTEAAAYRAYVLGTKGARDEKFALKNNRNLEYGMAEPANLKQYNAYLDALDKLKPSSTTAPSYKGGSKTNSEKSKADKEAEKSEPKKYDWIENSIKRIERTIKKLQKTATSVYKSLSKRLSATSDEISEVTKEIALQQSAYKRYLKEANSIGLSDDLKQKVRDGTINIQEYDEKTSELISEYQEWYEKSLDCADAIDDLHESLASLYEDKFDYIEKDYENQKKLLEHLSNTYENGMDELEAKGRMETTVYYAAKQSAETQKLAALNKELADLTAAYSEAMASGEIEKYSEAWYDYQNSINGVKEEIQETKVEMLELAKAMREVEWGHFDYLQEQISQLTSEADFLIDLLDADKLYDDQGKITENGMATMGLHSMNYNVYMAQADKYADEMLKIEKQLALDPYNKDLIARKQELLGLQQESILAAKSEKQAIADLVNEGIELELDSMKELIDKYTEALDNAKDLYEYQKKVNEQTKNIASIEKQLAAYENDDSEETKATIQKLKVELEKAQEELQETEYEKYVSDQKALLDNLYTEYEAILNQRMDNIDMLVSEAINSVNANADSINSTLIEASNNVGYTMTDNMQNIWNNATSSINGVVSVYGDGFNEKLTSINSVLLGIQSSVQAMVLTSSLEAIARVASTTTTTPTVKPSTPTATTKPPTPPKNNSTSKPSSSNTTKKITVGGKVKASPSALIYDYPGEKGEKQYFANDPTYTVLKEQNGYVQVRYHKLSKGVTGWFKKSDVKAYKTGGIIDYTGLAQVDGTPGKPELVLNAQDTENFVQLKDVLKRLATQSILPNSNTQFGGISTIPHSLGFMGSAINLNSSHNPASQSVKFGDINIAIDHVDDYDDFVRKLQQDGKFEKMIQSMTIDRLNGGSSLAKNKYRW